MNFVGYTIEGAKEDEPPPPPLTTFEEECCCSSLFSPPTPRASPPCIWSVVVFCGGVVRLDISRVGVLFFLSVHEPPQKSLVLSFWNWKNGILSMKTTMMKRTQQQRLSKVLYKTPIFPLHEESDDFGGGRERSVAGAFVAISPLGPLLLLCLLLSRVSRK